MQMIDQVTPHIRRITAPNPGPLTYHGTNTYIIGTDRPIILDPGPDDDAHLQGILDVAPHPCAILVTHSHLDHSALVPRLRAHTGADVYAYGSSFAGRNHRNTYGANFPEGLGTDHDFRPDHLLKDGAIIPCDNQKIIAHWTPGHFSNHLCFEMGDVLFTGDLIMGWASTLIAAPEGNVLDFMGSCARLLQLTPQFYMPGHGDVIANGKGRVQYLMAHRDVRRQQILDVLEQGPATSAQITERIYTDIPDPLIPVAQ
ncbi:MAG: MBL fold metallo-hydrolase, partial [Pseudomonadota bacterium]